MGKYFTFVDRNITLEFFEENPVKVTLSIGDDMDRKLTDAFKKLRNPIPPVDKIGILNDLIGAENTSEILERMDDADGYALDQLLLYIHGVYIEGKEKNLQTAKAGRKRK